MTRGLRVVPPGADPEPGEPVTMAEALADLATRVAAERPVTVVLLYENADGAIVVRPLPASMFVAKVLVAEAYDQLHPEREVDA